MQNRILAIIVLGILTTFGDLYGGAWTLTRGRLWVKSSLYYQSTNRRFCTEQDSQSPAFHEAGCREAGDSAPFDPFVGGESKALAILTELNFGTTGWLDVGVQIPFYSLEFLNLADPGRPGTNNIGDIRFSSKLRVLSKPIIASVEFGAKSPTGEFTVDAEAVNVSEGQWDFEFIASLGQSFWPVPGYANLDVGYRIRTDNPDFEFTFGNEFFGRIEAGYGISEKIMLKGTADWLRGERPQIKSSGDPLLIRRELYTVSPALIYSPFQPLQFEASVRFTLAGQDFPDGRQYIFSVSYAFSVFN